MIGEGKSIDRKHSHEKQNPEIITDLNETNFKTNEDISKLILDSSTNFNDNTKESVFSIEN